MYLKQVFLYLFDLIKSKKDYVRARLMGFQISGKFRKTKNFKKNLDFLKISNFKVGKKRTFVIAEIGNNHNGSVELALEMVDAAHEADEREDGTASQARFWISGAHAIPKVLLHWATARAQGLFVRVGGAQDKARDGEALGLVRLLGKVRVVRAHLASTEASTAVRPEGRGAPGDVMASPRFNTPRPRGSLAERKRGE